MNTLLDFEKPIAELEGKVKELRLLADGSEIDLYEEIAKLEGRAAKLLAQTYGKLSPWQKTQVARHPDRPHFQDYVEGLVEGFTPLAGDRSFGDDQAIIGGLARFRGLSVVVIGHEKGRETDDRVRHNFGMARPEGYRKAVRLMGLGERFRLPVLTFVDTPGAHPGVDAEERGQAEAIAASIETCLSLTVPTVATVVGEGGSGGAIALAAADRVLMLEHAIYSVISPEGCAAILWRSAEHAGHRRRGPQAHRPGPVPPPARRRGDPRAAGRAPPRRATTVRAVGDAVERHLRRLMTMTADELRRSRGRSSCGWAGARGVSAVAAQDGTPSPPTMATARPTMMPSRVMSLLVCSRGIRSMSARRAAVSRWVSARSPAMSRSSSARSFPSDKSRYSRVTRSRWTSRSSANSAASARACPVGTPERSRRSAIRLASATMEPVRLMQGEPIAASTFRHLRLQSGK
jgi:acetyl-CoA carboxylase carboxyl transferase subunit alpha